MNAPHINTNTLVSKPMLERIISATCLYYDVTEAELKEGKAYDQVDKKHLCWFLIKDNVAISYQRIGQRFNNASGSTVQRAVEKIMAHKNIYARTLHDINQIKQLANTLV